LADLFDASDAQHCLPARFFLAQAGSHAILDIPIKMTPEFRIEVLNELPRGEHGTESAP
jgi:hypothetical protein